MPIIDHWSRAHTPRLINNVDIGKQIELLGRFNKITAGIEAASPDELWLFTDLNPIPSCGDVVTIEGKAIRILAYIEYAEMYYGKLEEIPS